MLGGRGVGRPSTDRAAGGNDVIATEDFEAVRSEVERQLPELERLSDADLEKLGGQISLSAEMYDPLTPITTHHLQWGGAEMMRPSGAVVMPVLLGLPSPKWETIKRRVADLGTLIHTVVCANKDDIAKGTKPEVVTKIVMAIKDALKIVGEVPLPVTAFALGIFRGSVNVYCAEKGAPGLVGVTRQRVPLANCQAYRAWRNQTGGPRDRTIGVYPSAGQFPASGTVTVFVAPDGHTGAPPAGSNPTDVGRDGSSVGKSVPAGSAVFVHYAQGTSGVGTVNADITEEA